jgi:hypothetical protein
MPLARDRWHAEAGLATLRLIYITANLNVSADGSR